MAARRIAPRSRAVLAPRRDDFKVVLIALVMVTALTVAWRAGALPFTGRSSAASSDSNASSSGDRSGGAGSNVRGTGGGPAGNGRAGGGAASGGATSPTPTGDASVSPSADAESAAMQRLVDLGYPVYCGGGRQKLVALTFDDGPGPYSEQTLKILKSAHAKATFFLVGKLLVQSWLDGIPAAEARFGAAFGDHSWNHVNMTKLSDSDLDMEIGQTKHEIERLTGRHVWMFRPPYGAHDDRVDAMTQRYGMFPIIWTIDSMDSRKSTTADHVLSNVLTQLRPGAIVLMHENRGNTLNALPQLLQAIAQRGYQTVTVPELLTMDPPSKQQLKAHSCS